MSAATWLVLGASSSIARAFALEAAGEGCNVLLAGRDPAMEAAAQWIRTAKARPAAP